MNAVKSLSSISVFFAQRGVPEKYSRYFAYHTAIQPNDQDLTRSEIQSRDRSIYTLRYHKTIRITGTPVKPLSASSSRAGCYAHSLLLYASHRAYWAGTAPYYSFLFSKSSCPLGRPPLPTNPLLLAVRSKTFMPRSQVSFTTPLISRPW